MMRSKQATQMEQPLQELAVGHRVTYRLRCFMTSNRVGEIVGK